MRGIDDNLEARKALDFTVESPLPIMGNKPNKFDAVMYYYQRPNSVVRSSTRPSQEIMME